MHMEGPSLYLAQKQLQPFKGKKVLAVSGNTKISKERMQSKKTKDIFAWGKHLVVQFDTFALRVHFMLFGTFSAEVGGMSATGDYKKSRVPRLALTFTNGTIEMYNCSLRYIESPAAKKIYDFSIDIMSSHWDPEQAYAHVRAYPKEEVADILLDQVIFAGVGNIIKNEILGTIKLNPREKIADIKPAMLKRLIAEARSFSLQFLKWRKVFKLRANLKTYQKKKCQHCGGPMVREKTGSRERWSYYCPACQRIRTSSTPR